jgi:hypothetical protein
MFATFRKHPYGLQLPMTVLSIFQVPVFNITFQNCIFSQIDGLSLGYDTFSRDFKEFKISFGYDSVGDISYDIPNITAKEFSFDNA